MYIVTELMRANNIEHFYCMDCHNSRVSRENLSLYPYGPDLGDWLCGDCLDDCNQTDSAESQ